MEFRWIAGIALWTLLIGPIIGTPTGSASRPRDTTPTHSSKSVSHVSPATR